MRVSHREAGPRDRVGRQVIDRCGIRACGRLGGQNALGTGHFPELRLGGLVTSRVVAGHPATLAHAAPNRGLYLVPRQNRVHVLRPVRGERLIDQNRVHVVRPGVLRLQLGPRRRRRVYRCPGAGPLGVGEALVLCSINSAEGVAGGLGAAGVGAARAGLLVRGNSAAPLGRLPARIRPGKSRRP
eukprot:scaffold3546_cov66-Phaeocystis_antarctica.AAC.4